MKKKITVALPKRLPVEAWKGLRDVSNG